MALAVSPLSGKHPKLHLANIRADATLCDLCVKPLMITGKLTLLDSFTHDPKKHVRHFPGDGARSDIVFLYNSALIGVLSKPGHAAWVMCRSRIFIFLRSKKVMLQIYHWL